MSDLYNSPCVRAPSTHSPAQVLTVIGTGDPAACSTATQKLFNFTCGANRTCGFNGVYQPPVRGQFFVRSLRPRGCWGGRMEGGSLLCHRLWEGVGREGTPDLVPSANLFSYVGGWFLLL